MRTTTQRLKIMQYLQGTTSHPSAEMVYAKVKQDLPTISLGTVYRNLNKLVEEGKALRLTINNEYRYDGLSKNHAHAVCERCGKIMDVLHMSISKSLNSITLKNFSPRRIKIVITGMCDQCKKEVTL